MSVIMMLAAAAQASVPMPSAANATPLSLTQPLSVFECRLIDTKMQAANLLLEARGARGYSKDGEVRVTPAQFVVVADQRKALEGARELFDNQILGRFGGEWEDRSLTAETQISGTFVAIQFRPANDGRQHLTIIKTAPPWGSAKPIITYSGFCGVQTVPQNPLSAAEAHRMNLP